jgi:hypothetical protein
MAPLLGARGVYFVAWGQPHSIGSPPAGTMQTRGLNGQTGYAEATSDLRLLWGFPGTCRRYGAHRIVELLYQYRM